MSFRSFIRHNFWLKLFSLMLATLIWFTIAYWRDNDYKLAQAFSTAFPAPRVFSRIPVSVMARPGDSRNFRLVPAEVSVTLTGEESAMNDLSKRDLRAYVDPPPIGPAEVSSQMVKLHVSMGGVNPVKIVPQTVRVEIIPQQ